MKKIYALLIAAVTFSAVSAATLPHYNIATVTTTNVNGKVDSLNVRCTVAGVVYGVNIRPFGMQFYLHDHTGGINVYSGSQTFGYTVHEGDSIFVSGKIRQFNGQIEISTLDTAYFIAASAIMAPTVVNQLNASTAAELVRINGLTLTSAWTPAGRGFNVNATNGNTTFNIRIDTLTTAYTMAAPVGTFDLIGIGDIFTQDTVNFTSGWEIHPRYSSDFIQTVGINEVNQTLSASVFPNPSNGNFVISLGDKSVTNVNVNIFDLTGKVVYNANQSSADFLNVNTTTLTTGLYVLEVKAGNKVFRDKIAVQK